MNIKGYTLKEELQNANSGFSKWGFAYRNGKEYFIKELINPVYPIDRSIMSEEMFYERRNYCAQYETKYRKFFALINRASRGNLVRINEFFRYGSRYYLITEKVEGKSPSMEYIASLNDEKKILLLKTVAHCFCDLHSVGIVHSDVKPDNILIKETKNGNYAAKLIDFDSGFIKGEVLDNKELGGELTYLAPETFLAIYGEDVHPDEKSDIFALGLLFHEYWCGYLPYYDENEYEYPYEAALDGGLIKVDEGCFPKGVYELITSMLDVDPEKRPSSGEIIKILNNLTAREEDNLKIKQISIRYDGAFGKTIVIAEDSISYRNDVHPSVSSELETNRENFPDNYLVHKKRPITDISVYEKIIDKIIDAGLWDLVKEGSLDGFDCEEICSTINCVCEGDKQYSYYIKGRPCAEFDNIVSVLAAYCSFPQKVMVEDPIYGEEEAIPPSPVVTEKVSSKTSGGDWFQPAGDL